MKRSAKTNRKSRKPRTGITSNQSPRTLFLSFTCATGAYARGEITSFEGGLFYFGCTREHFLDCGKDEDLVFDRTAIPNQFKNDLPRGMVAYRKLRRAVLRAEKEGRAMWRRDRETLQKVGDLNRLLAANSLPEFPGEPDKFMSRFEVIKWFKSEQPDKVVVV
jgi:hypothetical protein